MCFPNDEAPSTGTKSSLSCPPAERCQEKEMSREREFKIKRCHEKETTWARAEMRRRC